MAKGSISKPWNWAEIPSTDWTDVSDEFYPVAHRWKSHSKIKALDLGCGRGRHTLFLAELGFSVTAVDLSPDGINQLKLEAQRRGLGHRIETFVCDMLDLSLPDKSFDCVLGFHSIYHTTYADLRALIDRVTRMLEDSGGLYVTFNSKDSPSFRHPSNQILDEHTVIKTTGIEAGIPHTYLGHKDILALLVDYRIKKLQQIGDYYDDGMSIHFFVEAEKK